MRVGVAGLGSGAVNALCCNPGLSNHPNIVVTAAADVRVDARRVFEERYGGRAYASVEEMCASRDIDAVYVLTPNAFHAEHAIMAAECGKQVIADKPMAMSMSDCDAMIAAAKRNGVRLLVGHSQSMDAGIFKMLEIIQSGEIGRPTLIATTHYSDWLYRPRSREELDPATLEGSLTLRQGWVQLDIVRMLGGGLVKNIRATTVTTDPKRPLDGAYSAFMEFENGTAATALFDAYGHFESADLTFGMGLFAKPRDKAVNLAAHRRVADFASPQEEYDFKDSGRFGGSRARFTLDPQMTSHQFFGLTIVSCERGALRQTPRGVLVCGEHEWREEVLAPRIYAELELDIMYDAWITDEPLVTHDGAWGKATTELCFALLRSGEQRAEQALHHQVPASTGRVL